MWYKNTTQPIATQRNNNNNNSKPTTNHCFGQNHTSRATSATETRAIPAQITTAAAHGSTNTHESDQQIDPVATPPAHYRDKELASEAKTNHIFPILPRKAIILTHAQHASSQRHYIFYIRGQQSIKPTARRDRRQRAAYYSVKRIISGPDTHRQAADIMTAVCH